MVSLFLSPQGRIAKGPFWMGVIVLLVVGFVFSAASTYGPTSLTMLISVLSIALIYPQVCVFVKRFHDAGKSGWWFVLVILVAVACSAAAGIVLVAPQMAQMQGVTPGTPEFVAMQRQMTQDIFLPAQAAGTVVWLVVSFVVSMLPSDPGENKFGPPTSAVAPAAA